MPELQSAFCKTAWYIIHNANKVDATQKVPICHFGYHSKLKATSNNPLPHVVTRNITCSIILHYSYFNKWITEFQIIHCFSIFPLQQDCEDSTTYVPGINMNTSSWIVEFHGTCNWPSMCNIYWISTVLLFLFSIFSIRFPSISFHMRNQD